MLLSLQFNKYRKECLKRSAKNIKLYFKLITVLLRRHTDKLKNTSRIKTLSMRSWYKRSCKYIKHSTFCLKVWFRLATQLSSTISYSFGDGFCLSCLRCILRTPPYRLSHTWCCRFSCAFICSGLSHSSQSFRTKWRCLMRRLSS
jgi:hypothetical protein